MEIDENVNPDSFERDDAYELGRNDEDFEIDPWEDKRNRKDPVASKGQSTLLHTQGKESHEEVNAIRSGIGDNDDLYVKVPQEEVIEESFQYAARHRGRKKHETVIYPEIPFEYGVHYKGEELVTDNEQPYDHRVDAYPGKTMKYEVTQKDPQPTKRDWEAQMNVHSRVKQDILEYAVNWRGKAATESVSGAADLFTSANGHFIGPGPRSVWNKSGNFVREIDNRSHASGIIAKEFYNWSDYEAEYEFKTVKATGLRNDPITKRVTSDGRLVDEPGADDDVLGFIFRAKSNQKDFYIFVWEGDDLLVSGWRPGSLSGYNMLTGNISGSYSHTKAENQYGKFMGNTNLSRLGVSNYYSGMRLSSAQMSNYRSLQRDQGWGNQHYRVYKVTNGVMRQINLTYSGNGRGWRQDWVNLNWKNSVKIRCTGREVKIYTQSYKQGNYNPNGYQLAARFNVSSDFSTGSVGLATFSQSVQFEKISVTRWDDISGRKPETGWNTYKDPGSKQISSSGRSYVNSEARAAARSQTGLRNPDYEITSVTSAIKDKSKGSMSASLNNPVTVRTNNPQDAGKIRTHVIIKKGNVTVTPEEISPATAKVVFTSANSVFGKDLKNYINKNPNLIFENYDLQINVPSNPLDDWDLEGEKFTMWRRNPKVIETTKAFEDKVYAYEGWIQSIDCRKEFDGLKWATYHLKPIDQTINDDYDEIELKNEKVYMKTTEWYMGTYPADIKSDGVVTNKKHVFIDIPPMPEHYVEPTTGEVMYHGYEDVEFLLIQIKPSLTNEVWMGFKSSFNAMNTNITVQPINIINGRPVIKTNKINDQVEIHCEDRPRLVPWTSGKYIGYGKVNGRRPFFKDGLGKADMIDVPTDVVYIPDHLISVTGPYIDVSDERVDYRIHQDKDTVDFSSNYMDAYIWFTDWYSEWKECSDIFNVKSNEVLTIDEPIKLDLRNDPTYDMADTIIDKFEIISTNPFVDVWTEDVRGEGSGWQGSYYQFPLISNIISESMQVDGDYHEMIQNYTVKSYMTEVTVAIQSDDPIHILEVTLDGEPISSNSSNGWSYSNKILSLHGSAIVPGELAIHYSSGSVNRRYALNKEHGEGITVFHKGEVLPSNAYQILNEKEIYIPSHTIDKYDWIHVQSYINEHQFKPEMKNYLGDFVGTRMDPEIWFDWGIQSPLTDFQTEPIPMMLQLFAASSKIPFQYDLEMEAVYPRHEVVDISNFTGEWEQFDTMPVEEGGLNGPGDWHGPPEEGYPEVTNLRNQNGNSGWYNPNHADLTDYTFEFTVQVRGGDDDMYGAIFKFDEDTLNHYSFEWDAYHSIGSGGTGVRGMAVYKNICQNPENKGIGRLEYTRTELIHLPISWTANANEINKIKVSAIGNQIKVWTNDILRFDIVDTDEPLMKGAWGPVTRSQPNTFFWDFSMEYFDRVTPKEEPRFRTPMTFEIERPVIDEEPMIEVHLNNQVQSYLLAALNDFALEKGLTQNDIVAIEYYIRSDQSPYKAYFKHNQSEIGVQTNIGEAEVYALVEGQEPPQSPPVNKEIPNQEEPEIDPIKLPEANPKDNFAASWSGYLYAPETGIYDFQVNVDDAVRMWVNNHLIIDEWVESKGSNYSASTYLEGGKWYPVKINYAEVFEKAHIFLEWKTPSGSLQRIGAENVTPYLGYKIKAEVKEETPKPWNPLIHNGYYYYNEKENYLYAKEIRHTIEDETNQFFITPRPRQGSPIILESNQGVLYRKVNFYNESDELTLTNREVFHGNYRNKYYLQYSDIDQSTLEVFVNEQAVSNLFDASDSSITFASSYSKEDKIEIRYRLKNSFYIDMNANVLKDEARVQVHNPENIKGATIKYEGHFTSPFYRESGVLSNPILNHNHKGFLYLTNKLDIEPKNVKINVSPNTISVQGQDKVNVTAQVFDRHHNPVQNKEVKILRDEIQIASGITNAAGEFYYQDVPLINEELYSVYRVECDEIENSALLNFFVDRKEKRSYIELKAGKGSLIAGSQDSVEIYATLRSDTWHILPNQTIRFEWKDTHNVMHSEEVKTDSKGLAQLSISSKSQKNGVVFVTATYTMEEEHAKSSLYIKVIGG
ncbi:MAG: hypothetical protein IJ880_01055 [Bacilli bacterium]|nr:hypothetical protein [Bacilli bacterium]